MVTDNCQLFNELIDAGEIRANRSNLFDHAPGPMPADLDFGRVEGMMLGLAIGDSLGNTTESQLPANRSAQCGEIRDYLSNGYADGRPVGVPSDDSQLAFWTLEQLLEDGRLEPQRLAQRFVRDQIFGIGSAVREFAANVRQGLPWYEYGAQSAGNGALMRIAPVLIPHLTTGSSALWADAAIAATLTHNDPASTAACVAFVRMLWELLQMNAAPEPEWWVETYVDTARGIEGETEHTPRDGAFPDYQGPIWRFVEQRVPDALARGLTAREACDEWYSGAYLLETMPSVLYILALHTDDPEEAIIRAVNDTKDNDTVGAIVGAAVGALHGRAGLPERWVANLTGRTGATDDGRMFELLSAARAFVESSDLSAS